MFYKYKYIKLPFTRAANNIRLALALAAKRLAAVLVDAALIVTVALQGSVVEVRRNRDYGLWKIGF